jgi:hypothetical protein
MKDEEYTAAIKQLQFLHIYGSLGPLPWQSATDAIPYRTHDDNYGAVLTAAKNIKVLHQGAEDTVERNFATAQDWLAWADRIIFLGFGFHKDNVERLALANVLTKKQKISGTCYLLNYTDRNRVEYCTSWARRLEHVVDQKQVRPAISFPDKQAKCYDFLYEYADLS